MAAVCKRDSHAFACLAQRHAGWALGFTERMLGSRHEAEDVVQTAFLRVWQGAAKWEPSAKFSTWLYRVLYNLCMDQFRARGKAAWQPLDDLIADTVVSAAPSIEEHLWGQQRDAQVRTALASLPASQRDAMVLRYYEELPQAEAAALMGVSEGALESLLSRARATLRTTLRAKLKEDLH
jgi:RNA polymerase sigma-70 factor, ECF subfamily